MKQCVNGYRCELYAAGATAEVHIHVRHGALTLRDVFRGDMLVARVIRNGADCTVCVVREGDIVTAALLADEYTKKLEELGYRPT